MRARGGKGRGEKGKERQRKGTGMKSRGGKDRDRSGMVDGCAAVTACGVGAGRELCASGVKLMKEDDHE